MIRAALLAAALFPVPAAAEVADFDGLPEGTAATTITDGGITFSNLNPAVGGVPVFSIERADGELAGSPGFTPRMALTVGGHAPGPAAIFGFTMSFEMSTGRIADSASIEVHEIFGSAGNTIALEALFGGAVVASDVRMLTGAFGVQHHSLAVSGVVFDRVRVVGGGPSDEGAFFALFDHVVIATSAASPFCFGDGSGPTACPCANEGLPGRGCDNSAATGGARLAAAGTTAPDAIVLQAQELPGGALAIVLQGDAIVATPLAFGDGIRCVGGALRRLYAASADSGGALTVPPAQGPSVGARSAALGDPLASGAVRHYTVWYRDPTPGFCAPPAGGTSNASNAVTIVW